MKKIFTFFSLVLTSLLLVGCSWFESPANVQLLGVGTIENDNGLLVVEIDSTKYAPDAVYANVSTRDGKVKMHPVEGMSVTAFKVRNNPQVKFIVGNLDREYLEEYFTANYTLAAIAGLILLIGIVALCVDFWKKNKQDFLKTKQGR